MTNMRQLMELTFPSTIQDAGEILKKYGYKRIGVTGTAYARVYHKEGENSVLKLYDSNDYAFTKFVNFCIQHPNEHLPKFGKRSIEIPGTEYHAVRMEMLKEGKYYDLTEAAKIFSYMAGSGYYDDEDFLDWKGSNHTLFLAFRMLINAFSGDSTVQFDLHANNFMMRGDTIVIIDPLLPKQNDQHREGGW